MPPVSEPADEVPAGISCRHPVMAEEISLQNPSFPAAIVNHLQRCIAVRCIGQGDLAGGGSARHSRDCPCEDKGSKYFGEKMSFLEEAGKDPMKKRA